MAAEKDNQLMAGDGGEVSGAAPLGIPVYVQDKVLSEIRHELGNFFHKLYYWAEYLRDHPGPDASDATAADMLERTIKNLEAFLKVSLGYFHPTPLSLVRMPVTDVVAGLMHQLRSGLNGTPVAVEGGGDWDGAGVMVDPGHLSHAFAVAVRHLTTRIGPESSVRIAIERRRRRDCAGVELGVELHRPNEGSPLFQTSEAGVEWALAERVVALHGGELVDGTGQDEKKGLTVFLPVAPPRS